ncbi:Fc.00g097760.m01.CDS01 [Cosmosporella sp. VM-42]
MTAATGYAGALLGPLTSQWEAPESCTIFYPGCSTCEDGWWAQHCLSGNPDDTSTQRIVEDDASCWPPRARGVNGVDPPLMGWGFYSPGLECPVGYTTACSGTYDGKSNWAMEFTLRPGETAVGCCPSGYKCTNDGAQTCIAIATTRTVVPVADCSGTNLVNRRSATFPDVVEVTTSTGDGAAGFATSRTMTLRAPMIQLNFQSTDISTSTSTASSTSSTSSPSPTNDSSDSGLSSGAKIGIGVGVGLGGLLLLAGLIWFILKRRKARMTTVDDYSPVPPRDSAIKYGPPSELDSRGMVELDVNSPPIELPAENHR